MDNIFNFITATSSGMMPNQMSQLTQMQPPQGPFASPFATPFANAPFAPIPGSNLATALNAALTTNPNQPNQQQIQQLDSNGKKGPVKCNICGQEFKFAHYLKMHAASHKDGPCKICGVFIPRNQNFQMHLAQAHPEKLADKASKNTEFKCQICLKPANSAAELAQHMKSHPRRTLKKCPECNKELRTNTELTAHLRIHTGEMPYECKEPGCAFRSKTMSNMRSHQLKFHHLLPHKCSCGAGFEKAKELKAHQKHTNCVPTVISVPKPRKRNPQPKKPKNQQNQQNQQQHHQQVHHQQQRHH